mmetsp:Transcript_240/g.502  ORF Transcript_240/g.502 Transcript_240/m.502 type:complete len:255 (-) Transcript_240:2825-3589(-)
MDLESDGVGNIAGTNSGSSLDTSGTSTIDNSSSGLMPMNTTAPSSAMPSSDNSNDTGKKVLTGPAIYSLDLQCPMEDIPFWRALYDRCSWLIGLLLFQSCSSYILADNVELLQNHPAIIFYLTMLVGAGGNAGNQAAVRIIRGMALGLINDETKYRILFREVVMGVAICALLSAVGMARIHFSSHTSYKESVAITLSLSSIVFFSVIIGSLLPFFLKFLRFDPVHASTSIQVIMDISGVLITCLISTLILKSNI